MKMCEFFPERMQEFKTNKARLKQLMGERMNPHQHPMSFSRLKTVLKRKGCKVTRRFGKLAFTVFEYKNRYCRLSFLSDDVIVEITTAKRHVNRFSDSIVEQVPLENFLKPEFILRSI